MKQFLAIPLLFVFLFSCTKVQQDSSTNLAPVSADSIFELQTKTSKASPSEMDYLVTTSDINNYIRFKQLESQGRNCSLVSNEVIPLRSSRNQEALMYLINYNEGWEVISGDKRTPAVLASCIHGNLNIDAIGTGGVEDGVFSWLDGEADGILFLREQGYSQNKSVPDPSIIQSNIDFWGLVNGAVKNNGNMLDQGRVINDPPGHWEIFTVETETELLDSCFINVPTWKTAAPYTTYDSTTEQYLSSPIVAAGKMMKAMYDKWGITQTIPTDNSYPTMTWSTLSNGYNSAVGNFLSQLCQFIMTNGGSFEPDTDSVNPGPRTSSNTEISIAAGLLSLYKISSSVIDYNASTVRSMVVNNGTPVVVSACNSRILWGLFGYTDARTFLIDKFRRYDSITTTTEVWIYDIEPGDPGASGFLLPVEPRVTVTHSYPTEIGMNWGFGYNSQYQTDGDDIWFNYIDWSIFGKTYPYERKMLSNIQCVQ